MCLAVCSGRGWTISCYGSGYFSSGEVVAAAAMVSLELGTWRTISILSLSSSHSRLEDDVKTECIKDFDYITARALLQPGTEKLWRKNSLRRLSSSFNLMATNRVSLHTHRSSGAITNSFYLWIELLLWVYILSPYLLLHTTTLATNLEEFGGLGLLNATDWRWVASCCCLSEISIIFPQTRFCYRADAQDCGIQRTLNGSFRHWLNSLVWRCRL